MPVSLLKLFPAIFLFLKEVAMAVAQSVLVEQFLKLFRRKKSK
jgi:hypothetical protein